MMIESITFDSANNKLIVELDDGTVTTYTNADTTAYLTQFPERETDLIAMGWIQKDRT